MRCDNRVTGEKSHVCHAFAAVSPARESCRAAPPLSTCVADMLKTFSLSILFFLALGLVVAAYATIPA
jgi:hypothetical protein